MIYVGAAESSEYDQVLDSIMVGPVPVGVNKFVFAVSSFSQLKESINIRTLILNVICPG